VAAYPCTVAATAQAESVIRELDASGAIAADHRMVSGGEIHLTLTDKEIATVEAHGLVVMRAAPLQTRRGPRARSEAAPVDVDLVSGFVTDYLNSIEVAARLATLAATFPALCSLTALPFPTSGYDGSLAAAVGPASVQLLRITTTPASRSKPGFLIIGGTHAREVMNPLIALEFAEQLLRNFDPATADPAVTAINHIVDSGDILIIPVLNPDGLNFAMHDDAGWRKNRRPNAGSPGCPGVDNNRNYEVFFGGAGSSGSPCTESFRGPFAFSEAENRNVEWVLEQFPNVLVGVDAHSFGRQILRPGPGGGTFIASLPVSAADHAVYTSLETTLGNAITSVNGAAYTTGSTSNHAGTSDEYMFFAHRVFGFNTECGTAFKPLFADAVPVIDEVVTGLKALAGATVDLVTTTPAPLHFVQCIDRTGSMVAFGYDGTARANAKRFVDMASLGDTTGIVSFADPSSDPAATPASARAQIEIPLTLLASPGDAATVRNAVDAISFGGWTSIGAGLKKSADLLAGAPAPAAVLLLSDGYENRTPTVAATLPALPAGLRVFTIALGPAADAPLLQGIATQTGGTFLMSPTALELHQTYNDMRAGITDEGLLLNSLVPAGEGVDSVIAVEPSAERLTVSVSTEDSRAVPMELVAPWGRVVRADDWGVRITGGEGYRVVSVERPAPGPWRVRTRQSRTARVVAAFVASPLRVRIDLPAVAKRRSHVALRALASFEDRALAPVRAAVRSQTVMLDPLDRRGPDRLDPDAEKPGSLSCRTARVGRWVGWNRDQIDALPAGFTRVHIEVAGVLPGGAPFQRVATRTVRVL